jgi:hypothetical protein
MSETTINYHQDAELFRDAIRFTASETGFSERLVEKDYFCTVALADLTAGESSLVFSVREPILETAIPLPARTLLLDPFRNSPAVGAVHIRVLTMREAYAEKFRAALTRREPAIRDFFDLDHAFKLGNVDMADLALLELLSQKLSIPGNEKIDVSPEKLERLREQLTSQLRPVLRREGYSSFELDRAFSRVAEVASRL